MGYITIQKLLFSMFFHKVYHPKKGDAPIDLGKQLFNPPAKKMMKARLFGQETPTSQTASSNPWISRDQGSMGEITH